MASLRERQVFREIKERDRGREREKRQRKKREG